MTPAESKSDRTDPPLTATDLDRLAALHEAATPGGWEPCNTADPRMPAYEEAVAYIAPFGWRHHVLFGDSRVKSNVADRDLAVAARNALPSLLALARRGLEADLGRDYAEKLERLISNIVAEAGGSCVMPALIEDARDAAYDAIHKIEDARAAALAEVERVRGRLERATNFSWRNGAVWVVRPEDSTLWCAYEEDGSCGAALIGKYDSLDAAWSAAEQAQAGQAAKQGGEGRT